MSLIDGSVRQNRSMQGEYVDAPRPSYRSIDKTKTHSFASEISIKENARRVIDRMSTHRIGFSKVFCSVRRGDIYADRDGISPSRFSQNESDGWLNRQETFSNIDWEEAFMTTSSFCSESRDDDSLRELPSIGSQNDTFGFNMTGVENDARNAAPQLSAEMTLRSVDLRSVKNKEQRQSFTQMSKCPLDQATQQQFKNIRRQDRSIAQPTQKEQKASNHNNQPSPQNVQDTRIKDNQQSSAAAAAAASSVGSSERRQVSTLGENQMPSADKVPHLERPVIDNSCSEGDHGYCVEETATILALPSDLGSALGQSQKSYWNLLVSESEPCNYSGTISHGCVPHGRGCMQFKNGDKYIGKFKHGQMHGSRGIFAWADGSIYTGKFVNNTPHGYGEYRMKGGCHYIGQFEHGRFVECSEDNTTFDTLLQMSPFDHRIQGKRHFPFFRRREQQAAIYLIPESSEISIPFGLNTAPSERAGKVLIGSTKTTPLSHFGLADGESKIDTTSTITGESPMSRSALSMSESITGSDSTTGGGRSASIQLAVSRLQRRIDMLEKERAIVMSRERINQELMKL